jgi:hypothetical protein
MIYYIYIRYNFLNTDLNMNSSDIDTDRIFDGYLDTDRI